jgi:hypothetical protein
MRAKQLRPTLQATEEARVMPAAKATRDHDEIRRWAEERGGIPTVVDGTRGLLRIDFVKGPKSGGREPRLREVSWDEWFRVFDQNDLVFLYDPRGESRFFKLVSPETLQEKQQRARAGAGTSRRRSTGRRGAGQTDRSAAKRTTARKISGSRRSRKSSRG